MTNQPKSTDLGMGRFLLNLFGILAAFSAIFTIRLSIVMMDQLGVTNLETGVAIVACSFSVVIAVIVAFLAIFGHSNKAQFIQSLIWIVAGLALGSYIQIPEAFVGSVTPPIAFAVLIIGLFGLSSLTLNAHKKERGLSSPQYRKHSGEKGFRIDTKA